jgi:phospholipid/cholesterol/gamma-HCH transport system substrate-binding protein
VPSQKQLEWSQLKVGLTVLIASVTLGILIFLMSGTGGLFTKKIYLKSYFDNAGGLRVGAPVRLQGVDIGNVTAIRVISDKEHQLTPVEVLMKVSTKYRDNLRKDSVTSLSTAGVLGETFIDIGSATARGPHGEDGDVLSTRDTPDINDVVRSSQSTLQNMDALLKRLDRIVAFTESGQGSLGKVIYDPGLYNRLNETVTQFQTLASEVTAGKGTLGKLLVDDALYQKASTAIDQINGIISDLNAGKGTAGKLLKDPVLFENMNKTMATLRQLSDEMNAGKGTLGKLAKDQAFAEKLQNAISNLSSITDRLNAGEGTAGKLLADPSLYDSADKLLTEVRSLIQAVRQNPKKYLTIRLKVF